MDPCIHDIKAKYSEFESRADWILATISVTTRTDVKETLPKQLQYRL